MSYLDELKEVEAELSTLRKEIDVRRIEMFSSKSESIQTVKLDQIITLGKQIQALKTKRLEILTKLKVA